MFREMLTSKSETEKPTIDAIGSKTESINSSQLKFREILCPKSCQPLSSKQCTTCPHRAEHHRAHRSGFSMVTMVCKFGTQNAAETND